MLWNIIRDFLVQYITGGYDSNGISYSASVGRIDSYRNGAFDEIVSNNEELIYKVSTFTDSGLCERYLNLSDWLATTITAIIMCLLVVFAVWLIRWIFKAVSSAFLLK